LLDCVTVLTEVRAYCVSHGINRVVFCGDLYHKRSPGPPTAAVSQVTAEVCKLRASGIDVFAIHGNHDQANRDGSVHALQPLIDGDLLVGTYLAAPYRVALGASKGGGRVVLAMVPYCADPDTFIRRVNEVGTKSHDVRVLIAHHGFRGAAVGSSLEHIVKEPIDGALLRSDWDFVFSGHYHQHQPIDGHPRAYYVGSPLQHQRSDRGEDKGFLVFDSDDGSIKEVPLDRPMFVTVTQEQWDLSPTEAQLVARGNFVDFVCEDAGFLRDNVEDVTALARGVKPVLVPKTIAAKKRLSISPALDPRKVIRRYTKYKADELEALGLGVDQMRKLGKRLLRESRG